MKKNIKEEFVSTLSHEIRTPLTSIKGFCQTMLSNWDKFDDEKKQEFLNIILGQSQRLINLVENVLNVAKIDSDFETPVLVKVDLNSAIQNCINITKMNHPNFDFQFNKSKNELFTLFDNDKIQQILLNVLDNAAKYSINSNKIEIKTFTKCDYSVCSIKNFGSFIEDSDKEKIFEKFFRVESYISATTQGSGLGLYIVKNLLTKMNGFIEVNSDKKENSTEFLIYFPAYEIEKVTKGLNCV